MRKLKPESNDRVDTFYKCFNEWFQLSLAVLFSKSIWLFSQFVNQKEFKLSSLLQMHFWLRYVFSLVLVPSSSINKQQILWKSLRF